MAEVLIGSEWIEVEETADEVLERLGGFGEISAVPMNNLIRLTASKHWRWSERPEDPSRAPGTQMRVSVLVIYGVRE